MCRLPPSPGGDCAYYEAGTREITQQRFYYDARSKRCGAFTYKGCADHNPNFPTKAACEARCTRKGRSQTPDTAWSTISVLQSLPSLITPRLSKSCQLTDIFSLFRWWSNVSRFVPDNSNYIRHSFMNAHIA